MIAWSTTLVLVAVLVVSAVESVSARPAVRALPGAARDAAAPRLRPGRRHPGAPAGGSAERSMRELWIKDDGEFGRLMGGNKPRKLEWMLADARRRGYRAVLTVGASAPTTDWPRRCTGAPRGLRVMLALVDQPLDEHVRAQFERILASGAEVHLTHGNARTAADGPVADAARHFDVRRMRPPYCLGVGGSSPLGCVGFVEAALELADQVQAGLVPEPAHLGRSRPAPAAARRDSRWACGSRACAPASCRCGSTTGRRSARARSRSAPARTEELLRSRGARFDADRHPGERHRIRARVPRGGLRPPNRRGRGSRCARARPRGAGARACLHGQGDGGADRPGAARRAARGPVLYWHTYDSIGRAGDAPGAAARAGASDLRAD